MKFEINDDIIEFFFCYFLILFIVSCFVFVLLKIENYSYEKEYGTAVCRFCKKEDTRNKFMYINGSFIHHKCID